MEQDNAVENEVEEVKDERFRLTIDEMKEPEVDTPEDR